MFTQADHDKAVELYRRFKDAEWWPKVQYHADIDRWKTAFELAGADQFGLSRVHALSAIAWAMAVRCDEWDYLIREDATRSYVARIGVHEGYGPTLFLALAAAVEATA